MFLSVSGHSSELSIAHHSPRSTVSQLKCVADRGCLFTELRFPVGFRVGLSSWIFELGFFGGIFLASLFWLGFQKISLVLHNVLRQRCCTLSRGLFKMEEKEDCRFHLSYYGICNCVFDLKK